MEIGNRVLKHEIIRQHSPVQLCALQVTNFCMLHLDSVDYGRVFRHALQKFDRKSQDVMKSHCANFLLELFKGLQKRLDKTLATMKGMHPFMLPKFKTQSPELQDFVPQFFNTDTASMTKYDSLVRSIQPLVEDNDTTDSFWLRIHNIKVGGEYKYRFLSEGVIKLMVLPLSNAEVERTFSASSHVKWWRRSRMTTDLLQGCLHCIFGLKWMEMTLSTWKPPKELLSYDKKALYE